MKVMIIKKHKKKRKKKQQIKQKTRSINNL